MNEPTEPKTGPIIPDDWLKSPQNTLAPCSKTLVGEWRYSGGYLCCGTLRIARADFDTDPSPEFKAQVFDQIVTALNAAPCPQEWTKQIAEMGVYNEASVYHIFEGDRLLARVLGELNASTLIEAHNASLAPCPIKDEVEETKPNCNVVCELGRLTGIVCENSSCDIETGSRVWKPEASPATTGKGPMGISVILDQIEQRAKAHFETIIERRSDTDIQSTEDIYALVKALRYAMDALSILHGDHGEEPVIEFAALTRILGAPSEGRVTDEQGGLPVTPNSSSTASTQESKEKSQYHIELAAGNLLRAMSPIDWDYVFSAPNMGGDHNAKKIKDGMEWLRRELWPSPALPLPLSEETKKDL